MKMFQLLLLLGLIFFFMGGGLWADGRDSTAIFFWILCIPFFIGFWKMKGKE
ncbi:MAG: hypothetical protein ABSE16_10265 [Verrucomicrobiota bacterium]|jgi:hypothetical protein